MRQLSSREVFNIPRHNIWDIEEGEYNVKYENDVIVTNRKKELIFNRYCWDLFGIYPNTTITSECDVKTFLGNSFFNSDTHVKLIERIFKHICDNNSLNYYYQKEPLLRLSYIVVNNIYNEIINRISDSVTTIDAVDFIEVINSEKIKKGSSNIKATPDSIDKAYSNIREYMNDPNNRNRFIDAYRAKAINENQANQCIGPRGFVTDLDRTVFKQPIINGFIKGMGTLYEMITESRTAAKSLNATDTHIKTSEYASRRIQLLTMSVRHVDNNDCGSTEYASIFITDKYLANMKGKYYLRPDTKTLDYIRGDEKHLIGTLIDVRTSFGCKAPDPRSICTTCLGKISENFKENSNLGYTMTSFLMEKLTQAILSTKHLTHSVKKANIKLEGIANKYFYPDEENNIYFNKDLNLNGLYLILPNSKLNKLVDVLNLPHTNIALNKIGELEQVIIKDTNHKTPIQDVITVSYRDRDSIITKGLLNYIRATRIESDARGNFVIPLEKYDKSIPVFNNPLKETNIISFVNRIATMIETTKDKISDPYEKFFNVFDAVIEQFNCNMSIIEPIIYATTTYNSFNSNYKLGRNSPQVRVENGRTVLFRHRSLSALLCYEDQIKELINHSPVLFNSNNRLDHPMDVLFVGPGVSR